MGRKIFVSYKYCDADVYPLANVIPPTWPCDYVEYIRNHLFRGEHIYKGEESDEDLSDWSHVRIQEHLKNKIYDSSVTIVLVSPNMKIPYRHEMTQWIPWEISYSLRETTRNDRTSHRNAILAVILPDKAGSYAYFNRMNLFSILKDNIACGYIVTVNWNEFINYPNIYIAHAERQRQNTPSYRISINL